MKRAAMSGSSFFKAVLSRRLLVTGFQVMRQSKPNKVSMPWVSIWALSSSWMGIPSIISLVGGTGHDKGRGRSGRCLLQLPTLT